MAKTTINAIADLAHAFSFLFDGLLSQDDDGMLTGSPSLR